MRKELFVSRVGPLTWTALREAGRLAEVGVERLGDGDTAGAIYKGRVTSILPGIQAAFVDVGLGRDALLHSSGLVAPGEDGRREAPLEERLSVGAEILVQLEREGSRTKGGRVTTLVTLPGRYLVYLPSARDPAVSRRIEDPGERTRLQEILSGLPVSEGAFIARTAARGAVEDALVDEARGLEGRWRDLRRREREVRAPALLDRGLALPLRALRDCAGELPESIVVDDPGIHREVAEFVREIVPAAASRVRLHGGAEPLLREYRLDAEIRRALRPMVWLKSGGYIVLEQTEALTSIDVNTGRDVGTRVQEETIVRANVEAAGEIARQLRLRDIGGLVVIDFIDMASDEGRGQVMAALRGALRADRARTRVSAFSRMGLVEMSRERSRRDLAERLMESCPLCAGRGRIRGPASVVSAALLEIGRARGARSARHLVVRVHPDVAPELEAALRAAEADLSALRVVADPSVRPDRYEVLSS